MNVIWVTADQCVDPLLGNHLILGFFDRLQEFFLCQGLALSVSFMNVSENNNFLFLVKCGMVASLGRLFRPVLQAYEDRRFVYINNECELRDGKAMTMEL
jgi:hypothetical protein